MKETIVERLEESGLGANRLIDVADGEKRSYDHEHRPPEGVDGNYGVHALADDELVILDVDDYKEFEDASGFSALADLPPTLEENTPHGGTHRFYRVPVSDGRFIAAIFEDEFDSKNPKSSWGEVRTAAQYVVAAGSQLDGCNKEGCEDCSTEDNGKYEIEADREIAEVDASEIVEVLSRDPGLESSEERDGTSSKPTDTNEIDQDELLEYALEESDDNKLQRLWRGDYSEYDDRSTAESALAYKLGFWLQGDKRAVRSAMDEASTKKWAERTDDSYRGSVLEAVDKVTEYYDPETSKEAAVPTYNKEEVERGEKLLEAECGPEDPAGELVYRNGHYGYWKTESNKNEEKMKVFDAVTNFTLQTLEHLKTDDSELLKIRVHPAHPMGEEYDVEVHPTVFNETRKFKEEIVRGKTTRYEPGVKSQQALNDLRETVGSQLVPKRKAVEHIGLHGDDYNEWVAPKGTLVEGGEAEDPDYRYYAKGGSSDSDGGALARKWNLDPESVADYSEDDVARIVELLPKTRRHDRGLPILGWFYAAPLRPLIHDWEGEFNLLQVVGSTGTGKTSTLKALWEAFGMDPDPFSASDTPFTLMKHMSSSCGIPVWIDEYKPADIRNDRLDTLHRRLREVTKGTAVSKGRANLGEILFEIEAPVVVTGEQKFSQSAPAVRRRAIMTTLSKEPTKEGSSYTRAFSRLTGTSYEDDTGVNYPEGYDLEEHARAYYQHILSASDSELEELWNQCRVDAGELLASRGLNFEPTEFQGAQTILFGIRVFKHFSESVGADMSQFPTDDDVADALEHFADNIGKNGQRRGYDDSFLELFAQAARTDYVEEDEDYRFIQSQKWGEEVLAFHMPSIYAGVKRYVRDYNVEDEYNLIGKNDYISAFKDKMGEGSYILKINHKARLGSGFAKCVVLNPDRAHEKLGTDFELRAFGQEADGDGGEKQEESSLNPSFNQLEPGRHTIEATVGEQLEPKPWLQGEGTLIDGGGDMLDYIARGDSNPLTTADEGEKVQIKNAKVTTDVNELKVLEVTGVCEVEILASPDGDQMSVEDAAGSNGDDQTAAAGESPSAESTGSDESAATDGGESDDTDATDSADLQPSLIKNATESINAKYDSDDEITAPAFAGRHGLSPEQGEAVLKHLTTEKGLLERLEKGFRVI